VAILTGRRHALWVAAAVFAVSSVQPASAQGGLESEVKAAFVYNFIKFIEWPPDAITGESFRVCLLGEDSFGGALERAVRGDNVDGHAIAVEPVPADGPFSTCQILFVPRAHSRRTAAVARALSGAPVLLVGESDDFLKAGGVINLVVEGGHVRFDVGLAQAASHGLRISSKLLRVARNTGGTERRDR
jgi:YfiR/HmsC-like